MVLSPQGDLKQTQVFGTLTSSCFTSRMQRGPLPAHRVPCALRTRLNCILSPPTARDRQKPSPSPRTALCQHTGSQDTGSALAPQRPGTVWAATHPHPQAKGAPGPRPPPPHQDPRTQSAAHPGSRPRRETACRGRSGSPPQPRHAELPHLRRIGGRAAPRALRKTEAGGGDTAAQACVAAAPASRRGSARVRRARPLGALPGAEPLPCPRLFPRDPSHGEGRGHAEEEGARRRLLEWQPHKPVSGGVEGGATKRRSPTEGRGHAEGRRVLE